MHAHQVDGVGGLLVVIIDLQISERPWKGAVMYAWHEWQHACRKLMTWQFVSPYEDAMSPRPRQISMLWSEPEIALGIHVLLFY